MVEEGVRVLVVGSTLLARKLLCEVLSKISQVEVVGSVETGSKALTKLDRLKPDLMLLDFDMPEGESVLTLKELKSRGSKTSVIIASTMSRKGAKETMEALEFRGLAFLSKPKDISQVESAKGLLSQLKPIISSFVVKRLLARRKTISQQGQRSFDKTTPSEISEMQTKLSKATVPLPPAGFVEIVAIGISTGGPQALGKVIPLLPENFRVPVVIVQHIPPVFSHTLAESLHKKSNITVVEGTDGMSLSSGTVYLAPGGKQMKIVKRDSTICLKLTDAPPENHCKPSVDYLFRSVADIYGEKALGVIMTGMGADGTLGLKQMKKKGCSCVIAQDKESCVVFGMPLEAMNAGLVDVICPLSRMAEEIVTRVN